MRAAFVLNRRFFEVIDVLNGVEDVYFLENAMHGMSLISGGVV